MDYVMESEPDTKAIINQKVVDYFSGTGYFGFQVHPGVVKAACKAVERYGISSGTSRAGYGTNPILLEMDAKASQFFATESTLYFASGCFGSPILLEGLKDEYDVIVADEQCHYSAGVGMAMAGKPVVYFRHMDPESLRHTLKKHLTPDQRPMVVCDGIFPVSGGLSPVHAYYELIKDIEGAGMCVDDAHATGVIGEKGHGSFDYFNITGDNLYSSGTLSKAIGGHGGIIAGSKDLIQKLKKTSVMAFACSSVPIPAAAATAKALEILYDNPGLRKQLWANVFYAKKGIRSLGFDVGGTPVPIICLNMPEGLNAQALQQSLFEKNIAVTYVPEGAYTSVPKGGAVRISIFANHSTEQIDNLIFQLSKAV